MVALVGCVLAGSVDAAAQSDRRVRGALRSAPQLREQMEAVLRESGTASELLGRADRERLTTVLVKNARGHLWHEHANRRPDTPTVRYAALVSLTDEERDMFENPPGLSDALPEVGSRALQRMFSGDCLDGWTFVQDDRYRFAVDRLDDDSVRVRIVIAECLAATVLWPSVTWLIKKCKTADGFREATGLEPRPKPMPRSSASTQAEGAGGTAG